MDIRPILLPQAERQARKAKELKSRGYDPDEIAAAMGLRTEIVAELLDQPPGHHGGKAAERRAAR
ncbi:conserved protein of unknown function [Rhodovastum atsumiense]|uniref:Uncharacterized protein n=1 Tax=Rhodovastum atsumiense TaxID=504468 RepID=A0A5M6IMN4_9PROT|nr:hypothetical protein [Rhodovastum atsumiense]KAA5608815.1 hypothetical protein F1189_27300 [Rhodovastum atsumiense]CAH2600840.1 conserved protein of unknown function [Rhodovastum atsumiense]